MTEQTTRPVDTPEASGAGGGGTDGGGTDGGDDSGAMTAGMQASQASSTGLFDALRPPDGELIDDCVHCGFCLPTCPTYLLEGNETNSPRGRIYLMKMGKAGEVGMDEEFVANFDACLGCMACVTACPSGVKYDQLIEAVRPQIERNWERTRADKLFRALIFSLFPYPARLRPAAFFGALYQRLGISRLLAASGLLDRLPARLRAMEALLPDLSMRSVVARQAAFTPAVGTSRHRVGLLSGCVQRVFFGDVNAAATRVLAAEGCDVVAPKSQQCCGALSSHAGREEEALRRARALIDTFEAADVQSVVVNVAGCGSAMKEYEVLLREDPDYAERAAAFSAKVRDISELLAELGPVAERHPIDARVAYHDACHLAHAQGIRSQPRELLRAVPGLELREIVEPDICCGSAGVYNLLHPEPATELGDRKAAGVLATGATVLVTANPGCLMQIASAVQRQGAGIALAHTVAVLDASIRGVPLSP